MLDGGAVVGRTIVARDWIERMAACSDRAVLRPPALAESERRRVSGASTRVRDAGVPVTTTCGSIPSSTASSSCAGRL
jgi:hypothetical protein